MELLYSTWRQLHSCKSTSFGCFCTPKQIITTGNILLKGAFFYSLYSYRVSSSANCGDIFRERTQTSALWRSHGCFGLYEVARWHIKSGMCREGQVLAMRRRGGAAGLQTFQKTTGKNWSRIDSDAQRNWASPFGDFCSMHAKKEHGNQIKDRKGAGMCTGMFISSELGLCGALEKLNNHSELSLIKVYFTSLISLDGMSGYLSAHVLMSKSGRHVQNMHNVRFRFLFQAFLQVRNSAPWRQGRISTRGWKLQRNTSRSCFCVAPENADQILPKHAQ